MSGARKLTKAEQEKQDKRRSLAWPMFNNLNAGTRTPRYVTPDLPEEGRQTLTREQYMAAMNEETAQ